jgi:mannose-1-phosphate guanylyltransferase
MEILALTIVPIIMAGGFGTRLWPISRHHYPKQFHNLVGERTMLQDTVLRLEKLGTALPLLICNDEHRFLASEQLRQIGVEETPILLEPVARNTAPAIALAALYATLNGADPTLLVLASDHFIADTDAFTETVSQSIGMADEGKLVTFGIMPKGPETGYGYIRRGPRQGAGFIVDRFEEKPDVETALRYVSSGEYYWNSGMFLFKASRYLDELEKYEPTIAKACRDAMATTQPDLQFIRVEERTFAACPSKSVDYAVMEKTEDAVVVPLQAGWSDIGSWSALQDVQDIDEDGNTFHGDVVAVSAKGTLARADSRLVALLGVEDLVVVETKDAILVAHKSRVQDVREIVQQLKDTDRQQYLSHREVYRPWGHYDSVDFGNRHQVKRITVKPGAKLSVQMHHHRAEHWVVVRGTARVQKGDETIILTENQSIYIPLGEIHALENPGKIPLELIEVQSGSYLGEDDIIRFEDRYGRG